MCTSANLGKYSPSRVEGAEKQRRQFFCCHSRVGDGRNSDEGEKRTALERRRMGEARGKGSFFVSMPPPPSNKLCEVTRIRNNLIAAAAAEFSKDTVLQDGEFAGSGKIRGTHEYGSTEGEGQKNASTG
ncbi:hypothetical protein CEXT_797411 [Caerostris extrusa]|uniref:Uncharacterized protein n=1 Tax=Caerostris extrusa TaxID=172846 RepID=A0AAV4NK21_CAEEX|nr:hypothetical protein CEXT_797411 [Caerostris extrusa]